MISISKFAGTIVLGLIGFFAAQDSALALTQVPGAECKPYGNSTTTGLYAQTNGSFNYSGNSMYVVCPITRAATTQSSGYFQVFVDGNAGSGTTYCWLYSYDYDNTFLGTAYFSASGVFRGALSLNPALAPYFS